MEWDWQRWLFLLVSKTEIMDKYNVKLVLIVLLALFLRLYRLSDVPVGFYGDEASVGYNAYSL